MGENTESNISYSEGEIPPVRRANKMDTWAGRVTENIGAQLRRWRRQRKLTAQALSDATAALGYRVPKSVITNLEHDRRDYISVAELLVLAAALNVPPFALLAPVGAVEQVEVLPNVPLSPWRARGWFIGALAPHYEGYDLEEWNSATMATKLFDRHRLLVRAYQQAVLRLHELEDDRMDIYPGRTWPQEEINQRRRNRSLMLTQVASYLDQIRVHRREIALLGFVLPALPPDVEADLSNPLVPQETSSLNEEHR